MPLMELVRKRSIARVMTAAIDNDRRFIGL